MTNIVHFNVGGIQYNVPRSLLEMHPNTMLARSASEQWLLSPDAEVFIKHDGICFGFVLDYLLDDGHVYLPMTIPKPSFMADLVYYGVENIDESTIVYYHDLASRFCVHAEGKAGDMIRHKIRSWYECRAIFLLTKECAAWYLASGGKLQFVIYGPTICNLKREDKILCSSDAFMAYRSLLQESREETPSAQGRINDYLSKAWLEVTSLILLPNVDLIWVSMKLIDI